MKIVIKCTYQPVKYPVTQCGGQSALEFGARERPELMSLNREDASSDQGEAK